MSFLYLSSPLGNRRGYYSGKYDGSNTDIRFKRPDCSSTITSLSQSDASKSPTINATTSDDVDKLYLLPSLLFFRKILSLIVFYSPSLNLSRIIMYVLAYSLYKSSICRKSLTIVDLIPSESFTMLNKSERNTNKNN